MNIRQIRDHLIQIPIICKLGTIRRNLFQYRWQLDEVDWSAIRTKYAGNGENRYADQKFLVVYDKQNGGIFVYLIWCMVQIAYALQNGYTPVVDLLNFPNTLRNEDQKDVNAWELYFKQPADISVEEIYGAHNIDFGDKDAYKLVYIGDVDSDKIYDEFDIVIDENKEFKEWYQNQELMKRFRAFWRNNIRYSDGAKAYIEEQYQKLFPHQEKVLGVLCRGTDYISLRPRWHYVQPTIEMIISQIQKVLDEYHYEYIFCATEDAGIYNHLKNFFGDKLVGMDVERVHYKEGYLLNDLYQKQKMDIFQRQLNYLTEMELLSRCQGLIAGKTTGSRFLPVMKDGEYEYLFYWELGRYE